MGKIEIFVSDKCPDCTLIMADYDKNSDKYKGVSFYNITASMANLKRFLYFRNRLEGFDEVKEAAKVGVPCKVVNEKEVEFL